MTVGDDWTLARGWTKAAVQIPLRTIGALVIAWMGLGLLRVLIQALEADLGQNISTIGMGLIVLLGLGTGLPAGLVLCRKLTESTGLLGWHLIAPACLPFLLGLVVLYQVSALTPPTWQPIAFYEYSLTALAACALAAKRLLLES